MNKVTQQLSKTYLYLIVLTLISAYLGQIEFTLSDPFKSIALAVVMLLVILKGQQIVDVFMELKGAPLLWRRLFLSYVILVPSIISGIYLLF